MPLNRLGAEAFNNRPPSPVTMPPINLSEIVIELEACEAAARVAEALVVAAFGRELPIPARAV
jgi:hypothetical protein